MGWVLSPMADSGVETLCTGKASGWSQQKDFHASIKTQKCVLEDRSKQLCQAVPSRQLCLLSYTKNWPAVQLEKLPLHIDLKNSVSFSLWLTEHLTYLATLVSLPTKTWLAINLSESAFFLYLLFLLRGWIYVWINPAAYVFGGFFDLFCDVLLFPTSVFNPFFPGCYVIYSVYSFLQAYYLVKVSKISFLVDFCECTGKRFV